MTLKARFFRRTMTTMRTNPAAGRFSQQATELLGFLMAKPGLSAMVMVPNAVEIKRTMQRVHDLWPKEAISRFRVDEIHLANGSWVVFRSSASMSDRDNRMSSSESPIFLEV